ncbi:hypothetical protein GTY20_37255 [Streptomyces sp. SID4946]|uniref:hypothetical protein n=1 Tax=Streptomyces sp. LamerLS-31b TaxID=1839765 RepID=UPI00081ECDE3|nr:MULTISPECIES: hypothetical protein [unclassified Streptomyces]MYQ96492.1 hypothetical protein [Streptomyces sp. SID4946]SCF92067.1 hypothetical protein GA0115258_117547 [Streptomyces sp. LamerLS-31b]SCG00808.1 hypothetical protein GA0115256_14346 [Streptomyces sp. DconLS]
MGEYGNADRRGEEDDRAQVAESGGRGEVAGCGVEGGLNTVLRFSRATEPEELFTGQWQGRPTKLDAFKPFLDQRWQEGCTNAWKLWEEIEAQGCPDGQGNVRAHVSRNLRGKPQPVGPRLPSAHTVTSGA